MKYYYEKYDLKETYDIAEKLVGTQSKLLQVLYSFQDKTYSTSFEIKSDLTYKPTGNILTISPKNGNLTAHPQPIYVYSEEEIKDFGWTHTPKDISKLANLFGTNDGLKYRAKVIAVGGLDAVFEFFTLVKENIQNVKNNYIETVIAEDGTYPDNGIQGDYWYVKTKKAIASQIKIDGVVKDIVGFELKGYGEVTLQYKDESEIVHDI